MTSSTGSWTVVAASVAGVSHAKAALPCQDAHGYKILPNGVLIVAVADGAGSATLAEVGAQIAVRTGLAELEAKLLQSSIGSASGAKENAIAFEIVTSEAVLRAILQAVRAAIEVEAEARGESVRELATTLLLVAASATHITAVQVGDGAIIAYDTAGEVFAVTTPPDAEYANATTFVTSPDALDTAQFVQLTRCVSALALFSDGLQRLALKMPDGTPHTPFFAPLFRFVSDLTEANVFTEGVPQLTAFLRSPRITERADDDLTLVLALKSPLDRPLPINHPSV